ncbi:MAG: glutamate formimidoyltransferase, partial [bacterium]
MNRVVECVPNFSEGRDRWIIDTIVKSIAKVSGVTVLDVDPGEATNRTVVTFVGEPDAVLEGAFQGIATAAQLIDMTRHKGEHPRIGATDVCPFVPISGVTMEDCVELAHRLGKRVGEELGIPVYLYEYAATRPERKSLSEIRKGEYESLPSRVGDPYWTPDYGPDTFNPRSGATVIGARDFLIAYNVNLNTRDKRIAQWIAERIREQGGPLRDRTGAILKDVEGNPIREPGKFPTIRAVGWYIDEYGRAQVSINITNYKLAPPHAVFDECCRLGEEFGVRVTGSELVGLIPLEALLIAGRHYLKKQGRFSGVGEEELVQTAIISLGLNDVAPFDPEQKIIEYRIRKEGDLVGATVRAFVEKTASDLPAPGGGSVAALCGALSAALTAMVANLTYGKKDYLSYNEDMERVGTQAHQLKNALMELVDRDTEAFQEVMKARSLPKATEEQKRERQRAIDEAMLKAAQVPLEVLRTSHQVMNLVEEIILKGNLNLTPDAGVANLNAWTATLGAMYNVLINLPGITIPYDLPGIL